MDDKLRQKYGFPSLCKVVPFNSNKFLAALTACRCVQVRETDLLYQLKRSQLTPSSW